MIRPASITTLLLSIPLALCATAHAQHAPLIERMADAPPASAQNQTATATPGETGVAPGQAMTYASSSMPAPRPVRSQIGDTTRALLRLQAEGSLAGNALPMLGETASHSYQRYLKSFDYPIPEYFEAALPNPKQGGSSR